MAEGTHRKVDLTRLSFARFEVTNSRGGKLVIGNGEDADFAPGEIFLAAIASCTAIDVDYITAKRAEAEKFDVRMTAEKVRDDQGNHLVDLLVTFDVTFPEGEAGDAAREKLPSAIERSHDRLCTVGRTVEIGEPIKVEIVGSE